MIVTVAALSALAAFLVFGLATDRHHERRFGRRPDARSARRARAGGWAAILACLALAIAARGWVFGPIVGIGLVMAGAAASVLLLNLLPPLAWPLARTPAPVRQAS